MLLVEMSETEARDRIREILQEAIPADTKKLEATIDRIMDVVSPFQAVAREEMERYRSTFAELAK